MKGSTIKQVSATGDVTTKSTYVRMICLSAGVDSAVIIVRAGGSGGTPVLTLKATAGKTEPVLLEDAYFPGGVHVTFTTGTTPDATFVYTAA